MLQLTAHESRVLGVLIEKAQTTPQQYPMSLNGLTTGCNQKNNREPITNLTEEEVIDALDGLRGKQLIRQVDMAGSRVDKYRHVARETLGVDTNQLVVLAELLLRGPQTPGELRTRAGRMLPQGQFESLEIVENILESLIAREEPYVRRLAPLPGTRAERFVQLLCPDLHPLTGAASESAASSPAHAGGSDRITLEARVAALEREVAQLKAVIGSLSGTPPQHE